MKIRITIENGTTQEQVCQATSYNFDNALKEFYALECFCNKHICVACGEPFANSEFTFHCSQGCKDNLHDPKDDLPF